MSAKFDPREHCCTDCTFFVHGTNESDTGFCYRYPPKVDIVIKEQTNRPPHKGPASALPWFQRVTSVPVVHYNQFCGEGVLK